MTFRKATYSSRWDEHGRLTAVLDLGDGFTEQLTHADLKSAIETIKSQRRKYAHVSEYLAALGIYSGALQFLERELELERD